MGVQAADSPGLGLSYSSCIGKVIITSQKTRNSNKTMESYSEVT